MKDSLKIGYFSCARRIGTTVGIFNMIARNPNVVLMQGDHPYVGDSASNYRGQTTAQAVYNSTVNDIYKHHLQTWGDKGFKKLTEWKDENHLLFGMMDDHEFGGDNWDYSITQANTSPGIGGFSGGIPSQAEVYSHAWNCIQAWIQMKDAYLDNYVNNDSGVVNDLPVGYVGSPNVNNFPPLYFRAGFTFYGTPVPIGESGDVEIFTISNIVHRTILTATDNASKSMLGAAQKAWLKAKLLASTATWKVINSSKKTYKYTTGDNGDTFAFYTTERNEILQFIQDNNITGVVWLSGDWHNPSVIATYKSKGATFDHACITACPIAVDPLSGGTGAANQIVSQFVGLRVYGWAEFDEDECRCMMYNVQNDNLIWKNKILAGSNTFYRNT